MPSRISRSRWGRFIQVKLFIRIRLNVTLRYRLVQGLTTNDVEELSVEKPLQYCMLLNVQGRVLYEVLLYRHKEQSCMIECDSNSINGLVKHLRKYMLRSKVI